MLGLRELSDVIDKEIRISQHDVTPRFQPNLKQIIGGMTAILDIMNRDLDIILNVGKMKKMKASKEVFRKLFFYVKSDIEKNRRWSFWHFMSLCLIVSVANDKLAMQNKHATIDLEKQETWNNPTWEVAVLYTVFVSSSLYKKDLVNFIEMQARSDVDAELVSRLLLRKMKLLNGEIQ
jgi:hypothetical protein